MKYIRTKDGIRYVISFKSEEHEIETCNKLGCRYANTIEELCDCFVKIKRKGNCKPYILKFDRKDLPKLKEQILKYPESSVYGAIHIEDKGLIYVAKMNSKGELELL